MVGSAIARGSRIIKKRNEPWFQGAHGPIGGGVAPADTPLNWLLLPTSPSAWDEYVLKEAVEVVKGLVMED